MKCKKTGLIKATFRQLQWPPVRRPLWLQPANNCIFLNDFEPRKPHYGMYRTTLYHVPHHNTCHIILYHITNRPRSMYHTTLHLRRTAPHCVTRHTRWTAPHTAPHCVTRHTQWTTPHTAPHCVTRHSQCTAPHCVTRHTQWTAPHTAPHCVIRHTQCTAPHTAPHCVTRHSMYCTTHRITIPVVYHTLCYPPHHTTAPNPTCCMHRTALHTTPQHVPHIPHPFHTLYTIYQPTSRTTSHYTT